MISKNLKYVLLCVLITACSGSSDESPASREFLIEFSYATEDIQALNITGYRVYANNKMLCESVAPYQMYVSESDCDLGMLSSMQRPFAISMTAVSNKGQEQESAHSERYIIN